MEPRVKPMNDRIGAKGINRYGSKMVVVEYNTYNDIWVEFERGNRVHTNWLQFRLGSVKNVYDKIIYNMGYIGDGEYMSSIDGLNTPQYATWHSMMRRCYGKNKTLTYKDVIVCEEWHNFQNFAVWYDQNYYQIKAEKMQLDKDILVKGNKIYSPETCVFVPYNINYLFLKRDASRGKYPIGVSFDENLKKYHAKCSNTVKGKRKTINIGTFNTIAETFEAYKKYKGELIKQIANEYKEKIPVKLYRAMMEYEININD